MRCSPSAAVFETVMCGSVLTISVALHSLHNLLDEKVDHIPDKAEGMQSGLRATA